MALKFCSFASGSSGNCYLVKTENTNLLIDTGIAGKRVLAGLEKNGLSPDEINGLFLTHEHTDHVKSVRMISKKADSAGVFATEGTLAAVKDKLPQERTVRVQAGRSVRIGDITVEPFSVSHDAAEPVGYSFQSGGRKISIVTDTGIISEEILENMQNADALLLEANHEVNILKIGPYSYSLKRRILSDKGHLSNDASAETLIRLLEYREKHPGTDKLKVILGHLSKINNTPEQAMISIKNILFESGYYVGENLSLSVADRDKPGKLVVV